MAAIIGAVGMITLRFSYTDTTPHAAPGPEDASLASGKIRSMLKKILKNGISVAVRFLLSLRVGSGTGLAGFDGDDGRIMANGPLASFLWGDQANPNLNRYALLSFVDPTINLNSWRALGHIQINTQVMATVMKNSLRVGTGTGLAATYDGSDGGVVASGAGASLAYGERSNPASTAYGALLLASGVHQLWDSSIAAAWLSYTASSRLANLPGQATLGTSGRGVRVGSGAGLDGWLTSDGVVVASGAQAAVKVGEGTNPASTTYYSLGLNSAIGTIGHSTGQQINHRASDGAVYGPKSLRVGSGTLTSQDGQDGIILSDSANAGLGFRLRDNAAVFNLWYSTGGLVRLWQSNIGDLWQIGTNGMLVQDALSTLSPNTNVTIGVGGFIPPGTRLLKPDGMVYLSWQLVANAALPAGYVIAQINQAAHRPTAIVTIVGRYGQTPATGYVNTSGQIITDFAMAAGSIWSGTAVYYQ
jgi:hypothetical protein